MLLMKMQPILIMTVSVRVRRRAHDLRITLWFERRDGWCENRLELKSDVNWLAGFDVEPLTLLRIQCASSMFVHWKWSHFSKKMSSKGRENYYFIIIRFISSRLKTI